MLLLLLASHHINGRIEWTKECRMEAGGREDDGSGRLALIHTHAGAIIAASAAYAICLLGWTTCDSSRERAREASLEGGQLEASRWCPIAAIQSGLGDRESLDIDFTGTHTQGTNESSRLQDFLSR